ncbi:conserved Plasmodium protein, unknown function [Plasmodium knowlesi strain H]|uniref:Uncharacterized protein n=3 Tax=Plasmodium knowlesi TaxID=5850 RepID=A0A5K1TU18_PLAKH|nr:conserved protein, unknown function [Plasmodium knowlesi strain H]OTN66906.1 Uncharacterized protein PKNOH_S07449400 [Plasmodium knowlesi]CAA9988621.1 conserved protein, unknown function [Plasmodium knowlesi strain H]SBO21463.1 conserved Plasmodium protein, unknown function [Plasmodium knowlesi strain H]SBO21895.1 conserved Plasmodium protein, unknown function [Plasmodium knowlesi strain H]VVS78095.1 conserved protein, unknown function [Plasmodium knowlesi strain H]|eukprot:XP_002259597.1 hypothetical protein, conserved in Plasmodium species [Plasmodium knowlesi strain H]
MLRRSKLVLLILTLLNLAVGRKTKTSSFYHFLGTLNDHLKKNHDPVFTPYKRRRRVGAMRVTKSKFVKYHQRYGKNVLHGSMNGEPLNENKDSVGDAEGSVVSPTVEETDTSIESPTETINKEDFKPNMFDYDFNDKLASKDIISEKMESQKNEVIKKLKMPIIGTQLKPSGGFTKEILQIIRDSNDYINVVNQEIIKDKIDQKMSGNDLSFFDTEKTLEEHEVKYLKKVYDNNHVLNIYNFLLVWKEKKNLDLSVFVSKITEQSNLLPGERTVIKFSEIEKVQFLKKIKTNRNVCVAMIFVDNKGKNTNEAAISHNMFPIGILAHPLDLSLLDKSGEISVLNLYRFKINSYNVTSTDFLVNAELFVDNNRRLSNFELTQENKKIIMNLYDKILELKIKYTEKMGDTKENEKFRHLEKITDRIDEYVNVLNVNKSIDFRNKELNFFTSLYLEYFSFLALDIHATIPTKLQMMYTDNTEMRLENVKQFLMQIYDEMKVKLRGL